MIVQEQQYSWFPTYLYTVHTYLFMCVVSVILYVMLHDSVFVSITWIGNHSIHLQCLGKEGHKPQTFVYWSFVWLVSARCGQFLSSVTHNQSGCASVVRSSSTSPHGLFVWTLSFGEIEYSGRICRVWIGLVKIVHTHNYTSPTQYTVRIANAIEYYSSLAMVIREFHRGATDFQPKDWREKKKCWFTPCTPVTANLYSETDKE